MAPIPGQKIDKNSKYKNCSFEHCCSCDMHWPEAAFQAKQLQEWRANRQEHLMTCASCVVDENLRGSLETRECERCKRTLPLVNNDAGKHLRSWGPVTMRNFLDRGNNAVRWLCYTCVYPECNTCLLYTSPSPRDDGVSRMPSSA